MLIYPSGTRPSGPVKMNDVLDIGDALGRELIAAGKALPVVVNVVHRNTAYAATEDSGAVEVQVLGDDMVRI